ncbi:MAG: NAD(P) transhydrogenase subunit alpha [Alphaproteobacteria bacterium RIFOXYD12_FULL_60_8]|nr:MAG: NAD(P) transhydrogenase subunit alpha [Alphaproteobacteria bacterium RIFOXYD12_FULL_60_8]
MKIAIPKERREHERRVAASPDTVKKFVGLGFDVVVEKGAGEGASFTDDMFTAAGATIATTAKAALSAGDVVLKITAPTKDEIGQMKKGAVLCAQLKALTDRDTVDALAKAGIDAFAMELMPRISRAQSMDILSSQSNLSGYKSVIDAAATFTKAFPMMMTSAGTIAPARVLVFGVGVAGLQAIATAKRLGAVVYATDVRPATKEQVESLGGKFVVVDPEMEKDSETKGGYAKQMPPEYYEKQRKVLAEEIKKTDIAITTALIPGRPAPELITEDMVKSMKPGSVIVDLAAEAGGNCKLTKFGQTVQVHGVTIIGPANLPSTLATDASALFAKNLLNFLTPHVSKDTKALNLNFEDETVSGTCVTRDGQIVHPLLTGEKKNG